MTFCHRLWLIAGLINIFVLKTHQSAGDNCSDPGYDQNTYEYGNGIFKFYEQSIGGSNVTVCQLVDPESGETANYIAVQGSDNVSKARVNDVFVQLWNWKHRVGKIFLKSPWPCDRQEVDMVEFKVPPIMMLYE